MQAKLWPGVRFSSDTFGGIVYVPKRDDFFAADKSVFPLIQRLSINWADIDASEVDAYTSLARLGIVVTQNPTIGEASYSGPSFLGEFPGDSERDSAPCCQLLCHGVLPSWVCLLSRRRFDGSISR